MWPQRQQQERPMLESFGIKEFKSYRDASLRLAPLTVLIGANASGKSNAIEALRLLSWIAQGNKLGSIRYAVQEADRSVRGKVADLGFRGSRFFSLSCNTTYHEWNHFEIKIDLRDDDDLHIQDERLTGPTSSVPLYEVVSASHGTSSDIRVAYNNFARGGKKPQVTCSDQIAVMLQLKSSARFESGHRRSQTIIPDITGKYEKLLSDMLFLDPRPFAMRDYSFKTEQRLAEGGKNLSGVLFNLCEELHARESVLEFIRRLPEQDIQTIDFIETPRGEVMIKLTETFGRMNAEYDATLLSDGTLRVLSIAAAVLSAARNSLVVIEEIDNGVHPCRAEQLLSSISRIAKQRGLRVLISSHNPALLDALPDDAVPDVVFCYRSPEDGSSQLMRLRDIPDYPELIAQGSVGHLMTRGLIERFVKTHPGSEERRRRALEWISTLRTEPA
jgi:energy-coupling factor transporter ATP-binding protein EcfA2